ncbi:MAG: Gfo/Idh/MocA family oxidoreductase [Phycisphaerales bacterium]|nr:Gfo/Idh/MocA family oxidoreductase [Phycisphaerales bacterium]
MTDQPIRVGILGFGFMGRTHAAAYNRAAGDGSEVSVRMIADPGISSPRSDSPAGNLEVDDAIDLSSIDCVTDPRAVLDSDEIDLVSICTPTDSHVDLAICALESGKHVLVEKPIAIHEGDVRRLADAASRSDRVCMPAMCMRYWPAWVRIKQAIDSREFGAPRSISFARLGSAPAWSSDFYRDESRSGGMLTDLHIHDTDYLVHCFGVPKSVTTIGDTMHISTQYRFDNGPIHAVAEAAWDNPPSAGFTMRCVVVFEHASLDFSIARDPQLLLHRGDQSTPIGLTDHTGYDAEARAMLDHISTGTGTHGILLQDAVSVARVLDAERQSLSTSSTIKISDCSAF